MGRNGNEKKTNVGERQHKQNSILGLKPQPYQSCSIVMHAYHLSTEEAEAGGLGVCNYSRLHNEFQVNLS